MAASSYNIVIPTRYDSSRFPGKPLAEIAGKPMILHVYMLARLTRAARIIIATDDARIETYCSAQGMEVMMTSTEHLSGTDRIAEVVDRCGWTDDEIVVCLQGDEPATPYCIVDQVAANLAQHKEADIATLCSPITDAQEYYDSDRVKVVFNNQGYALYFSRASIPHRREALESDGIPAAHVHVGLYAYRCHFLREFSTLQAHRLELEERLEQLRALAYGYRIHVDVATDVPAHGVDRPEDVASIEKILLRKQSA